MPRMKRAEQWTTVKKKCPNPSLHARVTRQLPPVQTTPLNAKVAYTQPPALTLVQSPSGCWEAYTVPIYKQPPYTPVPARMFGYRSLYRHPCRHTRPNESPEHSRSVLTPYMGFFRPASTTGHTFEPQGTVTTSVGWDNLYYHITVISVIRGS